MGSSLFILLAATLAIAKPSAAAEKKRDIRIVEIEGSVWIRQGNQREWAPIKLEEGFWPTEEGDAIKTGPAPSRAVLQMDKDNTVEIGHHTIFEIESANFTWSKFKLMTGRIVSKIEEKLRDANRGVNIVMPSGTLAVRGTEFAAETAQEDGEATDAVAVFEGEVEAQLTKLEGAPSVAVLADQELDLVISGEKPSPRAIRRFEATRKRLDLLRERHKKLRERWSAIPERRRKAIRRRQEQIKDRIEKRRHGQ